MWAKVLPPSSELEVMSTIFFFYSIAEVFLYEISFVEEIVKIGGSRRRHQNGVANFFGATFRFLITIGIL